MKALSPLILVVIGSILMGMAFGNFGKGESWFAFSMGAFFYGVAILGTIKGW